MRWFLWVVAILLGVASTLALTGKAEFRAETMIEAPPEKVWAVLTDPSSYADWNPVLVKVEGTFGEGETMTTTVLFPDGDRTPLSGQVARMVENSLLQQKGGIPGFVTFNHIWRLEAVDGGTKVIQYEVDRGLYMWFWDSSWVEPAYQKATDGLKAFVEAKG